MRELGIINYLRKAIRQSSWILRESRLTCIVLAQSNQVEALVFLVKDSEGFEGVGVFAGSAECFVYGVANIRDDVLKMTIVFEHRRQIGAFPARFLLRIGDSQGVQLDDDNGNRGPTTFSCSVKIYPALSSDL